MKGPEKRSNPRYLLQIPVRLRCHDVTCSHFEIRTHTVNISRCGLLLRSPQQLNVRSSVSLALHVPTEVSGSVFNELRCKGRVVHEQELEDGTKGYGVEIELTAPALGHFLPNRVQLQSAAV
jgi:hypothetical protein